MSEITRTFEVYSDINKYTPLEKSRITNEASIANSIKNILNIKDKEILFDFSNQNVASFLFKNYTEANAFALRNHIIESLAKESRISLNLRETDVVLDPSNNFYSIYIKYDIKGIKKNIETRFKI